jgi:GDP-4-dehydro-6-deoxy-D-mannose reductase
MNVVITGISGSGGSYLAEHILKKKHKVYGLLRDPKKKNSYNIKCLKKYRNFNIKYCPLNNVKKIIKIFIQTKPDIIFHLASNADVRKSFYYPYKIIKDNNACTLNLLEAARLLKIKSRIMICSTAEVYGDVPKGNQPITESNAVNPMNPYAVSKTFQDLLAQNYYKIYNLDIIITRMFTYLNARRKNLFSSAFAYQILKLEKNNFKKKVIKHGNLDSLRSILDIRDAMEAYWVAAIKGKKGEIYNISSNYKISVGDFLDKLLNLSKYKIYKKLDKKLIRPNDISLQVASCDKFKKHTKWKPKYNLDKSINFFYKECKKNFNNI